MLRVDEDISEKAWDIFREYCSRGLSLRLYCVFPCKENEYIKSKFRDYTHSRTYHNLNIELQTYENGIPVLS